ncbi:MAG: hypothetical protein FJ086_14465, partial [Deltaproteobacteria bacterium]|nr:hypothetical protein [Deltaproteobacteria bacterium]
MNPDVPMTAELRLRLAEVVRNTPWLDRLVLHGSRARSEERPESDWDFAFGPSPDRLDLLRLLAELGGEVHGEVGLAGVEGAGAVLRFNIAREGVLVFERRPGALDDFREQVSRFWCEAGEVIEAAQA